MFAVPFLRRHCHLSRFFTFFFCDIGYEYDYQGLLLVFQMLLFLHRASLWGGHSRPPLPFKRAKSRDTHIFRRWLREPCRAGHTAVDTSLSDDVYASLTSLAAQLTALLIPFFLRR